MNDPPSLDPFRRSTLMDRSPPKGTSEIRPQSQQPLSLTPVTKDNHASQPCNSKRLRSPEKPEQGQKFRKTTEETTDQSGGEDYLQHISQLHLIVAMEKMSIPRKTEFTKLLGDLNKTLTGMHNEIIKLKAENNILKQTKSVPIKTYAQTLTTPKPTQKTTPDKKHTLFISGGNKNSKDIQKIVTQTINPTKDRIRIKNIRTTEKLVILETETEEDLTKIQENEKLKQQNLKMEKPRKRLPLVIIYDVQTGQTEQEIIDCIYYQNFEDMDRETFNKQFTLKFKTGPRNRQTVHHVAEVSPQLRKSILTKGRLYVGFSAHTAKDYLVVPKCLKCQDLGHIAKHCRKESASCGHCGETDHLKTDCSKIKTPRTCIPCALRKRRCDGEKSTCPTYKMIWERTISRIDYG